MFPHPSRRAFLGGGIAFAAWSAIPRTAIAAAPRDPRLITLLLRGGMDGVAALAPVGDPQYDDLRAQFAMPDDGPTPGIALDPFFALNPRLPTLAKLYRDGEALFVHAVHSPYRERSHFDGQDVLENGTDSPAHDADGWLGRAASILPVDSRIARQGGFAAAAVTPLVMRGMDHVISWLPSGFPAVSSDTHQRLLSVYEHTDPTLAEILTQGLALEEVAGSEVELAAAASEGMDGMSMRPRSRQQVSAAIAAGRAMAADDGPRLGFLEAPGFDTHRQQRVVSGTLGGSLEGLDLMLSALRDALGPVWSDTVVVVLTEFGRTVRMNGSMGTDHGMATVAMLAGGAVNGGRIIADWPGLTDAALYEGRDLRPTTDIRQVIKGTLRDHLGLTPQELATRVFPDTPSLPALDGLIR